MMLDLTTIPTRFEAAFDSLSDTLSKIFHEHAAGATRAQSAVPSDTPSRPRAPAPRRVPESAAPESPAQQSRAPESPAPESPAPESRAPESPAPESPAPKSHKPLTTLRVRPNLHVVPSQRLSLAHPDTEDDQEPPSAPSHDEMAAKIVRLVWSASVPPTFERLRRSLRVSKLSLTPVVEQLVAHEKIRVVEEGDVLLYKPPRIEPIRRRRAQA